MVVCKFNVKTNEFWRLCTKVRGGFVVLISNTGFLFADFRPKLCSSYLGHKIDDTNGSMALLRLSLMQKLIPIRDKRIESTYDHGTFFKWDFVEVIRRLIVFSQIL